MNLLERLPIRLLTPGASRRSPAHIHTIANRTMTTLRRLLVPVFSLYASLLLTSCTLPPKAPTVEDKVKEAVQEQLKDPESARFGEVDIFPLLDGEMACGTVNAKNTFGGYVGDRHFQAVIAEGNLGAVSLASDEIESFSTLLSCDFFKTWGAKPGNSGPRINKTKKYAELRSDHAKALHETILPQVLELRKRSR